MLARVHCNSKDTEDTITSSTEQAEVETIESCVTAYPLPPVREGSFMEELKDTSIHHTALRLAEDVKTMKLYGNLYKMVQKLSCSPEVDKDDMKQTLEHAIKANGLEVEIRNVIYHLIRNSVKSDTRPTPASSDPLNYLRRAGIQWERRVRKSLNSMCSESKAQLHGQMRTASDREEILSKWDELSTYQIDLSNYRPVYAPKDLLDVLLSLKGPMKQDETE